MPKMTAAGAVLPSTPQASIASGTAVIQIESVTPENEGILDDEGNQVASEHLMVMAVYPDGFRKNHQVKDAAGFAEKVLQQLRNRYAITGAIEVNTLPKLTAGSTFIVELA